MKRRGVPKVQATIRLPKQLYEQAKKLVNCGEAVSINDFVIKAMRYRMNMLRRKEIDAQFAHVANDTNYQKGSQLIVEEFESSDSEVLEQLDQ